ncbi:hypothetical protein EDD15DRAFT_2110077, partial [Pisolithus albus]
AGIVNELEPFYPSAREVRQSRIVARTLQGAFRHFSSPLNQKQPLTREHLRLVMEHTPCPISFDDLLFRALLETGFFGLNRVGELTWPDKTEQRDYSKLSWRHSVILEAESYQFILGWEKSDTHFEGNKVVVQRSASQPDPVETFTHYLITHDQLFPCCPQLWLRRDGSVPLHGWFVRKLHTFLPSSISGHSMRAGGTTSLAAAGVPPAQIQ